MSAAEPVRHSLSVPGWHGEMLNLSEAPSGEAANRRPTWLQNATLAPSAWLLESSRGRLLALEFALLLVVGLAFGLGLRLGPQGLLASSGVGEGERFVHCAEDERYQGKLMLHLMKAESLSPTSGGVVSPFAKLRIGNDVKDSRFARFGWKSNVDVPTHHNDANPDWSGEAYGERFFCLDASTVAGLQGGDGAMALELWDYNYMFADEAIGSVLLDDLVWRAVRGFGQSELHKAQLPVIDGTGGQRGRVEIGARWFPTADLESLIPALRTGDVVLFSGDTHSGRVIKSWTNSEWSHVGLVAARPGAEVSVLEASTNRAKLTDCDDGKVLSGVERLGMLDKVYSGFYDRVSVRLVVLVGESLLVDWSRHSEGPAANDTSAARTRMEAHLERFYEAQRGKPYEEFRSDMVASAFSFASEYGSEQLFCSEFASAAFLDAGLWETDMIPSNVMPREFASHSQGKAARVDFMAEFAQLSTEIYLRRPQRHPTGRCYEQPAVCQCGGSQGVAYSSSMACWLQPCDSMLEWWFGSAWDAGFGLDVEICVISCVLLWVMACLLGNLVVLSRHRRWRSTRLTQAGQVLPVPAQSSAELSSVTHSARVGGSLKFKGVQAASGLGVESDDDLYRLESCSES